jgi:hypothetical protein
MLSNVKTPHPTTLPAVPKSAKDILVEERKSLSVRGNLDEVEERRLPLSAKIEEFMLKLGYSNAHVLGIVVQLLTSGKVRVDYRDYSERLQLVARGATMDRQEAVALFERYLERLQQEDIPLETTQKIMVQPPPGLRPGP